GDTVDLSDTDEEGEENNMIVTEPGNIQLSISWQSGLASRSGTTQDLDSEMQVDQVPDGTDRVALLVALSNGNVIAPTDHNRGSTTMEVESSRPAAVPPPDYCPVTVSSIQHGWALSDHRLYCQPGTWEKDQMDETMHENRSDNTDGTMQRQESLEQLTDTIHGKMWFRVHGANPCLSMNIFITLSRWTKKVDLFSKWLLLIPIHLEIHWSLVTVTMATKTISYYDSQGIVFRHTTDNIMKYLQSEAREKKQTAFQKGWKITIIKGIPQQKNDSDCGVFVLEYCRRLSVKQPLLFSQDDMPRIRKRIYKELCDRRLND
ncbi:sentrin-specific protease-like, partial [Neolamprologus brichardi]|uniref:sentrin-specific protease-like n=1 Tax=Neolamprologus brichardi TaxID=32507 RepID=UPI001643BEDD